MIAVARKKVECRDRARFVDESHVREGDRDAWAQHNRGGAAARSGTRAVVFSAPVVGRRRMLYARVVIRVRRARRLM